MGKKSGLMNNAKFLQAYQTKIDQNSIDADKRIERAIELQKDLSSKIRDSGLKNTLYKSNS